MLPSVEAQSLDHWIAREVPRIYTLKNKSKQTKNKPHQFPGRRYTLKAEVEKLETLEDYDRVLEEMEDQIKELKRIKRRKKKMLELQTEKEEIKYHFLR